MQNPGVLWVMIKQCQFGDQFRITIEESLGVIQKVLVAGFGTNTGHLKR
jgi:hypothetical protein